MRVLKALILALLVVLVLGAAGAMVLIRRGFRATNTPTNLEVAVTRTLRNLAMPAHDRNQKNALAATADYTNQGRET